MHVSGTAWPVRLVANESHIYPLDLTRVKHVGKKFSKKFINVQVLNKSMQVGI